MDTMGILRATLNFINANSADEYYNGAEWAETLIEVDADVSPMQAERMAQDLSSNPQAFHDGLRDTWNAQPECEQERGFFSRLIFGG
jgi:hypothetical protein